MGDNYAVASGHKSLLAALGCFWCGEQAFEQYAPGVVEAVSGYAGGSNDFPTYRNHARFGHYEVVLVEYDPEKTSYKTLVEYAFRNMDPLDGGGQFCDRGVSYRPAIFYETEEEREAAEEVLAEILADRPEWEPDTIRAPLLERPVFWKAEEYHQDYYIKKPRNYGYYKNACGRSNRLKEVWGEEEYKCYHDLSLSCFGGNVTNDEGAEVVAEVNLKNAAVEKTFLMPIWGIAVLSSVIFVLVALLGVCLFIGVRKKKWRLKEKQRLDEALKVNNSKGEDSFTVEAS